VIAFMVQAILFDMGGTLDGGPHWLDRFARLYEDARFLAPRDELRAAFDEAERLASADQAIATAHLDEMIARHVGWQLDRLVPADGQAARRAEVFRSVTSAFVRAVRDSAPRNLRLLADLASAGFRLGVVSNGCGNVDVLCEDLGYRPFLSVIIDSRRIGIAKPDPRIYACAASRLRLPPSSIMMVGDSLERDVKPAKSVGMAAAWLAGPGAAQADRALADVVLGNLDDLRALFQLPSRTVA
jgi:putative hydrolase of the HAD superfamily